MRTRIANRYLLVVGLAIARRTVNRHLPLIVEAVRAAIDWSS